MWQTFIGHSVKVGVDLDLLEEKIKIKTYAFSSQPLSYGLNGPYPFKKSFKWSLSFEIIQF